MILSGPRTEASAPLVRGTNTLWQIALISRYARAFLPLPYSLLGHTDNKAIHLRTLYLNVTLLLRIIADTVSRYQSTAHGPARFQAP